MLEQMTCADRATREPQKGPVVDNGATPEVGIPTHLSIQTIHQWSPILLTIQCAKEQAQTLIARRRLRQWRKRWQGITEDLDLGIEMKHFFRQLRRRHLNGMNATKCSFNLINIRPVIRIIIPINDNQMTCRN